MLLLATHFHSKLGIENCDLCDFHDSHIFHPEDLMGGMDFSNQSQRKNFLDAQIPGRNSTELTEIWMVKLPLSTVGDRVFTTFGDGDIIIPQFRRTLHRQKWFHKMVAKEGVTRVPLILGFWFVAKEKNLVDCLFPLAGVPLGSKVTTEWHHVVGFG